MSVELTWSEALAVVLVCIVVFEVGYILGGWFPPSEDIGEKHTTLLTFENEAQNVTYGEIYVMDGGQWDLLHITVEANQSTTVKVAWYGDYNKVTVFAVFDYGGYESIFRYELQENEYRTVFLI